MNYLKYCAYVTLQCCLLLTPHMTSDSLPLSAVTTKESVKHCEATVAATPAFAGTPLLISAVFTDDVDGPEMEKDKKSKRNCKRQLIQDSDNVLFNRETISPGKCCGCKDISLHYILRLLES